MNDDSHDSYDWDRLPLDLINGKAPFKAKCANPYRLLLLEYHEDVMHTGSGIVLLSMASQTFGNPDVLPKWRVIAVGDAVEETIGIKKGDMVIVGKTAGKLRNMGNYDIRIVDIFDILARIRYEPKDFRASFKQIEDKKGWTKI